MSTPRTEEEMGELTREVARGERAPQRMAKGGKPKSEYSGYIPSFEDDPEALRRAEARGAKRMFDADSENAQTRYETYRNKKDPSSAEMSKRLGAADEEAAKLMKRRHRDADAELDREEKRFSRQQEETEKASRGAGAGRGFVNPPIPEDAMYKRGGDVKKYAKGGKVASASKRADGIAKRGKTKGRYL